MNKQVRLGLLSTAVVVVLWEVMARVGLLDPLVASSPSRIFLASLGIWNDGRFLGHIQTSSFEFFLGFGVAVAVGIVLGLPFGWYARLRYATSPAVSAAYAAPRVAVMPLLVLWFGFGQMTTAIVVFLGAVFVVLLSVMLAVASVDPALIRAARAYAASDLTVFRAVVLPAVFPSVITGLRLAIPPALAGVVYGEIYAASSGLGYYVHITASTLQMDKMFVALMLFAVVGLALNILLSMLQTRFSVWLPQYR